jgi:hypothetical protein
MPRVEILQNVLISNAASTAEALEQRSIDNSY